MQSAHVDLEPDWELRITECYKLSFLVILTEESQELSSGLLNK